MINGTPFKQLDSHIRYTKKGLCYGRLIFVTQILTMQWVWVKGNYWILWSCSVYQM